MWRRAVWDIADLPANNRRAFNAEDHIHRITAPGRAGASGVAVTFGDAPGCPFDG
jgi:superfamily II DNA/RNA helicase